MGINKKIAFLIEQLKSENISTWFDLGLFLDRVKEQREVPAFLFNGSFSEFRDVVSSGGIGFLTFQYSIDGVSIEVQKYTKIYYNNFPNAKVHYITGKFYPESDELIDKRVFRKEIPEIQGFDDWKLYKDFFFTKLQRGSKEYNELIIDFWDDTLQIIKILGEYLSEQNIKLLYLINVCSNPGNVSLALAIVLISEYLQIPIISNSHDYYWEGGNSQIVKEQQGIADGPRDFFFLNDHIGEFFSIIEILYPWNARHWMQVNINKDQSQHLINKNGINPANVLELGTAVDTKEYRSINKRKKLNTFYQFEQILSRYSDTLISYSADDVIINDLVDKINPGPILIGSRKTKPLKNFLNENIIFLQPTRIIERKRIATGFYLINKLFNDNNFYKRFKETSNLKLTVLVTGPIATGHYDYFKQLLEDFRDLLKILKPKVRSKVFLAFLFSELDKNKFKSRFENPVGIPELYNIASLVLLPSETEGRGLPIIEATACGVPIFCSRYYPENVYSEVIGEHLPEEQRLKVIEFDGLNINDKHVKAIIDRVFYPHKHIDEITQNKNVIDQRYSLESLDLNIQEICHRLYLQIKSNKKSLKLANEILLKYLELVNFSNKDLEELIDSKNREYLPGYGRMQFMIYLKSLIDPSYFRIEENENKGIVFDFANRLLKYTKNISSIPEEDITFYLNTVENVFQIYDGDTTIRHDHSFSYRHRNKQLYPYQTLTIQELTGLVNYIYHEVIDPVMDRKIETAAHFFTDWNLALSQLTTSTYLGIDDREILIRKLQANIPIAYFPGKYIKNELEFFALQSVRSRLELNIDQELNEEMIIDCAKYISPIYIFAHRKSTINSLKKSTIEKFISEGSDNELKLLYQYKIIQIIETNQLCIGIHFPQIGEGGLRILRQIKEEKGIIISSRKFSALMTDIVDLDRFHIGKISQPVEANIMGIPVNSGYIQFVPASVRTTLAYPTPIQTAKDFHQIIHSSQFKEICDKYGEQKVYDEIIMDAKTKMSPIQKVLDDRFLSDKNAKGAVEYSYLSGVYEDRMPWNGVIAKVNIKEKRWKFVAVSSDKTKKVTQFVNQYSKKHNVNIDIAWNGGYILNAELVGKLGLPESYIGSPLGLLIVDGEILSPPLFNKPALIFTNDGDADIRRVDCSRGLSVSRGTFSIHFPLDQYNTNVKKGCPVFYDLMFSESHIKTHGNVIVRLAGNVIKDIVFTKENDEIPILPVGLTLSIPKEEFPSEWDKTNLELNLKMHGFENILSAIEAGPLLIDEGKVAIDMEKGGWKTNNSIKTQAARLDYLDMRGPKIAIGLDKKGCVLVLTVNGRIRESVGATHVDMAKIMKELGAIKAMGFDPGGSSTLVINGKAVNISPYNKSYEENVYALPPEPRAVSNAVLGFIEN